MPVIYCQDDINNACNIVWNNWIIYTDGSSSSLEPTNIIWQTWSVSNTEASNTSISITNQVWNNWITTSSTTIGGINNQPVRMTAEEIESHRIESERLRIQHQEETKKREEIARLANEKAEELLRSLLTEEQIKKLETEDWFPVVVNDKEYRIERGSRGNVVRIDKHKKYRYCIHPTELVPDADTMIAQKLMLESNEEQFLKIANRSEQNVA